VARRGPGRVIALSTPPGPRERARLRERLSASTVDAARALLGCVLVRRVRGRTIAARIVETEAYLGPEDPAAHAYSGRTRRTEPLFGLPGTLYVYFVYGVHHCLNLKVDRDGFPGCVLVRAAEPSAGSDLAPDACRGPGRLCRALDIDASLSGRHVFEEDWKLTLREGEPPARIVVAPRVGLRRAADRLLRFCDAGSAAVSRPVPPGVSFERPRTPPATPVARRAATRRRS
jgi:DNA-3-methyladenine glycosylase